MNNPFTIPLILCVGWFAYVLYSAHEQDKMISRFEIRCEQKGGVTLRGVKNGDSWIGCYEAKEIYNEVEEK